jgi:hypothetical protein
MAAHVVVVDLVVKRKGSIKVNVNPWEQHSRVGDTVSWKFTGDIVTGRIDIKNKRRAWPFAGRRPPLLGTRKKRAKTGRRADYRIGGVTIPYTITLEFRDPAGGPMRTAVIDPDMVIDV